MRILLIEPSKGRLAIGGEDVYLYEPLALEYIAAGVAGNHDVRILDLRLEKGLPEVLAGFSPDVVGITAYTVHVNAVRRLFHRVKRWNPQVLTVVGGHHATVVPEDFLSPSIDLIVLGEGVFVFREIVERFERGDAYDGIAGLAFAKNGKLVRTDCVPVDDLDALPFPERGLTAGYRHRYYSEWMKPLASIRTSKGCPYRCSFCALWKLTGGHYLRRRPDRVVEELASLDEEFVFFADAESLVDAARMKALAEMIAQAGIQKRYFLYGRSDTIARNPDLLGMWRDIGLERVFVGLEFFTDQDLDHIKKGTTIRDNQQAVHVLHDLGIEVYASFIIRPEFGKSDFARLKQYCRELELRFAAFGVLTPLPGTDFHEQVRSQLITHNYDFFDVIHTLLPTEVPLKEFYAEYWQLYARAIPFTKLLASLTKCQWREIPTLLFRFCRLLNRIRTAHLDYGDEGGIQVEHVTAAS